MGEYAGVKTIPFVITKLNHHSMLISFQKFIVEDNRPLGMVYFSMTMCHKRIIGLLANILCCEVCKGIRKLSAPAEVSYVKFNTKCFTCRFKISNMFKCLTGWFRPSIF